MILPFCQGTGSFFRHYSLLIIFLCSGKHCPEFGVSPEVQDNHLEDTSPLVFQGSVIMHKTPMCLPETCLLWDQTIGNYFRLQFYTATLLLHPLAIFHSLSHLFQEFWRLAVTTADSGLSRYSAFSAHRFKASLSKNLKQGSSFKTSGLRHLGTLKQKKAALA